MNAPSVFLAVFQIFNLKGFIMKSSLPLILGLTFIGMAIMTSCIGFQLLATNLLGFPG